MKIKKLRIYLSMILLSYVTITSCSQTPDPEKIKANVVKSEFIYETAPFPQCHASTIIETKDGLLAAWFGGSHEKHPDVCIYLSQNKNGKWGEPKLVADGIQNDTLRYPCWNPVLFQKDDGIVVLYYKVGPSPREWWGLYKTSADKGLTWSEAKIIPDNLLGPIKNKPVKLADGRILYPTSFETEEKWNIYVENSSQNLENWTKTEIDNNGFNAIQPTVLFHKNGSIQMLCRSREKKIVETWSSDGAKTWSPVQATSLVNNNSGIDAVTLKNGLHLLVNNPVERGRNKLDVKISADGKSWFDLIVLEDQPRGEFSYPAIIEGKDRKVYITYTYNREKIKFISLELVQN